MKPRHRLHWRCGVLMAGLCTAAIAAALPALPSSCEARLLQRLGWQIHLAAVTQPQIDPGHPCQRADLAAAQAAGDLQLRLPLHHHDAQTTLLLRQLLEHPATQCAFAFELGAATGRATARLQDNPGYRFSALQLGWIGFGIGGARRQGWQRFRSFGRGYAPAAGNAQAIEAFYSGTVRSECGVGRQVAQLATLRELFGDAAFDRGFTPGELSIGTFLSLHDTDSILLGHAAGEMFADGKAVKSSRLGRQAFVGAPGFIEHVFERRYLDDIHNQAENFVVTGVSEAAAAALAEHGGFAYYDDLNQRIWRLAQALPGGGRRYFQRLLHERDPVLRAALTDAQRQPLEALDALLDDPFYRGFQIYVHRQGVRPIGYHIVRLLDRNPRTPYAIDLALHNLHTTIWQRWKAQQLRDCRPPAAIVPPLSTATR